MWHLFAKWKEEALGDSQKKEEIKATMKSPRSTRVLKQRKGLDQKRPITVASNANTYLQFKLVIHETIDFQLSYKFLSKTEKLP